MTVVLCTSIIFLALYIICPLMLNGLIVTIPLLLASLLFKYRGFFIIIFFIIIMTILRDVSSFSNGFLYGRVFFVSLTGLFYSTAVGLFVCVLRHCIDLLIVLRQKVILVEREKMLAYAKQQQAIEAERCTAQAYEQQQQINQQKDLFLAHVNHELCTPLVTVLGYLELLLSYREYLDEDKKLSYTRKAMDSTQELKQLVTNLLDTAQLTAHNPSPHHEQVSLAQVVQGVLAAWNPCDLQDFTFSVEIPETLMAWADRSFLFHILRNLLSNACKYAPRHTTIRILASHYGIGDTPEVCLSVKDEGKGIPPDQATMVFERFVRLPQDMIGTVRGTGLGLYICKQLVEAQSGRIWVESSSHTGNGSCFSFTLPAAIPERVV